MFSTLLSISLVSVFTVVVALLFFYALKVFFSKAWFKAWLKGTLGISSFFLAVTLLFFAFDLFSYSSHNIGVRLANISIQQLSPEHFQLMLSTPDSTATDNRKRYDIYGDMWQLDARIIVWNDFLVRLGLMPVYRLDRLSGRYQSIEDEQHKTRSVYQLSNSDRLIDAWALMKKFSWLPGVKARYGSGTFVPLVAGASYAIYLRQDGLIVRPENARAQQAIQTWAD